MKILTKAQFAETPLGTLYRTCINSVFTGELSIKSEQLLENQSWWALNISPWLMTESDTLLDKPIGSEIQTEGFCTDDAIYNYDNETMFAVFNKQEIQDMIERLQSATGY